MSSRIRVPGGITAAAAGVFLLISAPCRAIIPPKATYDNFDNFVYERNQELCDAGGTLKQAVHSGGGLRP